MMDDITITVHSGRVHGARGRFVRKSPLTHVCQVCGVTFDHKRGGTANKACNRTCGFELLRRQRTRMIPHDHPPMPKVCRVCSAQFISTQPHASTCSHKCRAQAHYEAREPQARQPRSCAVCSSQYIKPYKSGYNEFCSDACKQLREAAMIKKARRIRKPRERARLRSATVHNVDPFIVFERDKWKCQLCGISTPKRLRGSYQPNAPELDHIEPLAHGGAHAYFNTQLACRKCNGNKGAKSIGQTRLAI